MFGGHLPGYDGMPPARTQKYCANCRHWYFDDSEHICAPDVPIDEARAKLEKFLGDDAQIHE